LQDWIYDNSNEFDLTLELGCNQYPPAEALPGYWQYNKVALVNLIREVHKGVKGVVSDEAGKPLSDVMVRVSDRDHAIKTNSHGEFFRPLIPGVYTFSFERNDLKTEKRDINLAHESMAQIHYIRMSKKAANSSSSSISGGLAGGEHEPIMVPGEDHALSNEDHSLVVATFVMSIVTVAMLAMMVGAYVIQKRRFARSQSVSVELQPRSTSSGAGLSAKTLNVGGASGLSSSSNRPNL